MPAFRTTTVTEILLERPGLTRVRVTSDDHGDERAYALTEVTGPLAVGDEVVVNTTAIDLGLGTGGWHVVHWNLARREWSAPGGGHIMKARYTSIQHEMEVAEERGGSADDLGGVPVVACSLHSQVGVVAAVLGHLRPGLRVAYVMTDGGALPLALSDLVVQLRERGLLAGTVTTGHAFGGDEEAVTVASGLAVAAGALAADVVVAGMGPGVVGTGSRLGFTGLDQATILDATAWLGGRPVMCVRASDGDARGRHQGISHHSRTVLDATRSGVEVPLPAGLAPIEGPARHEVVDVDGPDVASVLDAAGLRITTMGRGPDADPLFFQVAAAAAVHAASVASS
ncbi:MAG TPA: DUF3866 family protein [Iamia sp.]|nr:DUF3866 family protein [Iamia sp.]